jgi:GNAT superfamily N-acetyltransferase
MERSEWHSHHRIVIKEFDGSDISVIVSRFAEHHWPKPVEIFEEYLREQKAGDRAVWVAHVDGHFAGYITLKWQSRYKPFRDHQIPEIMDLNILPPFRKIGAGLKLLVTAESEAATRSDIVGIGVGLYGGDDGGYGAAQRLYVTHGYIPDGRGVTYNYQHVVPGNSVPCDDDLVLWFARQLKRNT